MSSPYVFFSNSKEDKQKRMIFEYINLNNKNKVLELLSANDKSWEYIDSDGLTPLYKAVQLESFEMTSAIINFLKSNLSDLEFIKHLNQKSDKGLYLVHEAVIKGDLDTLILLIENGADVSVLTKHGLNNLHVACHTDQVNLVVYLVEILKFNPSEPDYRASLPLHWACYFGSENCAKYLLTKVDSKDINAQDIDGFSYLHLAVLIDRISLIKYLLINGINYNLKDNKGRTALDLAKEKYLDESVKILSDLDSKCSVCSVTPKFKLVGNKKSNANIFVFYLFHFLFEFLFFSFVVPCK
jgi:ankyrin repeat protein